MALQDARDFTNKLMADDSLRQEVHDHWEDAEKIGSREGFKFNRDEFKQAMHEHQKPGGPDPADGPDTCLCI